MADRTEWSPPNATHVKGVYDRRVWDPATNAHEPQIVDMECTACGAKHRVTCEQGRPREHIATFARVHFHADALAPVKL